MKPINFFQIAGAKDFKLDLLSQEFLRKDFDPSGLVKVIPHIGPFNLAEPVAKEGPFVVKILTPGKETFTLDPPTLTLSAFDSLLEGTTHHLKSLSTPLSKESASHFWGDLMRPMLGCQNVINFFPQLGGDIIERLTRFLDRMKDKLEEAAKILGVESYSITMGLSPSISLTFKVSGASQKSFLEIPIKSGESKGSKEQ